MPDKGWKKRERRIAKMLGTHRLPCTGERDGADCETELFAYQVKSRKLFPGYVADWLDGIRGARPQKIGVVVMQRPHHRDADALVVLSLSDWLDLHREKKWPDDFQLPG